MKYALSVSFMFVFLINPGFAQSSAGSVAKHNLSRASSNSTFEEILVAKEKEIWEVQRRQDVNALKSQRRRAARLLIEADGSNCLAAAGAMA